MVAGQLVRFLCFQNKREWVRLTRNSILTTQIFVAPSELNIYKYIHTLKIALVNNIFGIWIYNYPAPPPISPFKSVGMLPMS